MELLDRLGLPVDADGRALALDDRERQAVDEGDDVEDDVLLRPEDPVLAGDDPLVAVGLVEVEEPDRVALASVAEVLLQGDAVGEGGVELLVGFGEAGGGNVGDRPDRLGEVGPGEPGVQAFEGQVEAAGEDGLLEAGAFAVEVFGRDVGVAEGLEEFDRGVFREVELVPAGGLGGHAVAVSVYSIVQTKRFLHLGSGVYLLPTVQDALQDFGSEIVVPHVFKTPLDSLAQADILGAPGLLRQTVKPLLRVSRKLNRNRHVLGSSYA